MLFLILVVPWQSQQQTEFAKARLREAVLLLKDELLPSASTTQEADLQRKVRGLAEATGLVIAAAGPKGQPTADSEQPPGPLAVSTTNPFAQVEMSAARSQGEGFMQRTNPTTGNPWLYYALRIDRDDETVGYLRAGLSVKSIADQAAGLRRATAWFAGLATLAVFVLTLCFFRSPTQGPVHQLNEAVRSITQGHYAQDVLVHDRGPLGKLAANLNRMSRELAARFAAQRQASDRVDAAINGMSEGVISVDAGQRLLLANRSAGQMLGFDPEKSAGAELLSLVRSRPLHAAVATSLESETACITEAELGGPQSRTLRITAQRLAGDPCPGVVVVMHDVTDIRRLENLRHEFVANVSHELKTPLSAIRASAETLRMGAINQPDRAVRFLTLIEDEADRLHELILDMLSLARIESGEETFDIRSLPVAEKIEERLRTHEEAARAKQMSLLTHPPDQGFSVLADGEGFRQILDNLLDNAIKYSRPGGEVHVTWQKQGALGAIVVTDNGIGIDREHLPRVFERFFRADRARSRELGSTGLGLAIVKHLAQSFKGSVVVDSTLGKGSTFTVFLPLAGDEFPVS
ncbi:HAMP domain-containing sensor histidine kinase [Lignipirellula cremea]|uniref:HAMP domain-containing sensor histidine kinase n=1 Tax=Lignipirellula cremea TaxID=2528010 RepID=UPI0018D212B8|nr:HAMP domain-containing sensor histidine kinase [Lignipirellula cremea]